MKQPEKGSPSPPVESRTYLPALDGVRGIAILLVMFHHFTIHVIDPTTVVDKLFFRIAGAGWMGVDLFFVLSGFLITGILFDTKEREGFFRNFYMRRCLRIFPLYYGFLAFFFILLPRIAPMSRDVALLLEEQGWYWSYLVNVRNALEGRPTFIGLSHFWSLAVEEQFYLLWPFVVFFCNRRQLMIICVCCIAGSFGLRVILMLTANPVAAYVLTPARMDTLAVGAWLALAARGPHGLSRLSVWMWPAAGICAAGLLAIFLWTLGLRPRHMVVATLGFTLVAAMFGAFLTIALTSPKGSATAKILTHPVLVFFGLHSYALYVFHHPLIFWLKPALFGEAGPPSLLGSQLPAQALFFIVGGGLSVFLAFLSWHFYEKHFLKLKDFFPYQPTGDPAASRPYRLRFSLSSPSIAGGSILAGLADKWRGLFWTVCIPLRRLAPAMTSRFGRVSMALLSLLTSLLLRR